MVVVVVGAVGKELPELKIACASAEREEEEGERESVLLCLPAALIWSPVLLRLVPRS